jgi:hypothetical protein
MNSHIDQPKDQMNCDEMVEFVRCNLYNEMAQTEPSVDLIKECVWVFSWLWNNKTTHNLAEKLLESFQLYVGVCYDMIVECRVENKISLLSTLAAVFIDTEYTGEYNKIEYLIRQELRKVVR